MDRKLLSAMIDKFGGGPVGVDNLAAAIGEARDTIEDVLEPYLIQQGYLRAHPARPHRNAGRLSAPWPGRAGERGSARPALRRIAIDTRIHNHIYHYF